MKRARGELHVYPDAEGVTRALADLFVAAGQTAVVDRGSFHVALAGGNTPRAAYMLLALAPFATMLSWSDVYVYFGDERCVPPDDEQSNYKTAYDALLGSVPIPPKNIHRMRGEIDPPDAAREYASMIRDDLGDPPRFDFVMLGMGADGHTASLFPGSDPMTDDDTLVRAVYAPSQYMWRITLTPRAINAAHTVVFSVEGSAKAAALAAVREGPYDPTTYPAQIIEPSGRLIWLADAAATATLKHAKT